MGGSGENVAHSTLPRSPDATARFRRLIPDARGRAGGKLPPVMRAALTARRGASAAEPAPRSQCQRSGRRDPRGGSNHAEMAHPRPSGAEEMVPGDSRLGQAAGKGALRNLRRYTADSGGRWLSANDADGRKLSPGAERPGNQAADCRPPLILPLRRYPAEDGGRHAPFRASAPRATDISAGEEHTCRPDG